MASRSRESGHLDSGRLDRRNAAEADAPTGSPRRSPRLCKSELCTPRASPGFGDLQGWARPHSRSGDGARVRGALFVAETVAGRRSADSRRCLSNVAASFGIGGLLRYRSRAWNWANALISRSADAGPVGRALRRQLDRERGEFRASQAVVSFGPTGLS